MNANLYYDCNGESWTILDFHSSITFSSERGLKQAINRNLTLTMRHPSWIFLFFGGRIVTFAPV